MRRKLVSLAIYISICMGVPRDQQHSDPNLYKQGMTPKDQTDQIKEDKRTRETEKGPVQNPSENSSRISGETKISLELGVRSRSWDEQLFFC